MHLMAWSAEEEDHGERIYFQNRQNWVYLQILSCFVKIFGDLAKNDRQISNVEKCDISRDFVT